VPWEEALERAERPPPPSYDPGPAGPYARQIAELAARLGQWEREGRERAALGEYDAAVAAFLRAVRQAEQDCPRDEDRLAELWAAAEACCDRDTELSETHLPECRRQVARYRRLPYIEVEVIPPETMVLNQYAEIEVKLRNTGGGGASQIVIHHTGSDFAGELGETQTMPGLRAGGTLRPKYSIYPEKPGHAPLKIEVEYSDATGRVFQAPPCRVYITVVERGSGDS
jgi:hypothetical protein